MLRLLTHICYSGECGCLPFAHYLFPTEPNLRNKWIELVKRQKSSADTTKWIPSSSSVICSAHFKDGKPTDANPMPTLNLGYASTYLSVSTTARPRNRKSGDVAPSTSKNHCEMIGATMEQPKCDDAGTDSTAIPNSSSDIEVMPKLLDTPSTDIGDPEPAGDEQVKKLLDDLTGRYMLKCMALKHKSHQLKQLKRPLYQRLLLTDTDVHFYTGLPSIKIFQLVIHYVQKWQTLCQRNLPAAKLVLLRYRRAGTSKVSPASKLVMSDRVLLVLMKLRLDLLHKDLADR